MEQLEKQIKFDEMAIRYLERLDGALSSRNLHAVRAELNSDSDKLLSAILRMDEVRGSRQSVILECKRRRSCPQKVS